MNDNSIAKGVIWKLLERFGVQGISFLTQIFLARLLEPEYYGILSIIIIFTSLANVFIQTGFNTALIQNKDVSEEDYSSVFWLSLIIAIICYLSIFIGAPYIAKFYNMPELIMPLRVVALVLFPGCLNSVQLAKVSREMDFKKVFKSNVLGIIVSGTSGIIIALNGGGLWALVVQNMLSTIIACLVMCYTVRLRIQLVCNINRVKILFMFGWKILLSILIDTLYQDLCSLVIGKKYDSKTLGYYNRGKQFPQFIINSINNTVQSVLLPAMSMEQEEDEKVKLLMRNSIMVSSFIIFPMMAGLAAVANTLVIILLTEKWVLCVPYLQISCFVFAFYPIHSCNLQAINAKGRSDINLRLEVIKKSLGLVFLIGAVFLFDTPIAIAMTGVITTIACCFINAYPNKKLINYSYFEQIKDLLPSLISAIFMFFVVSLIGMLCGNVNLVVVLLLQILFGIIVYLLISFFIKSKSLILMIDIIKNFKSSKTVINKSM